MKNSLCVDVDLNQVSENVMTAIAGVLFISAMAYLCRYRTAIIAERELINDEY